MGYSIFRLKLEWTGSHYVNRLELGDDSMNAPVDIRFIDYPGWIENVHSVFFDVNGRDSYSPSNTGGLITTSDTGDLVFFDPSNAVGRTLSQLYAGGGGDSLWMDTGSHIQLIDPKDVSLQNHSIKDVFNIYAYDSGSTDDEFSILSNTGVLGFNIKFTDNNPSAIDTYADLNVHEHNITNVGEISGDSTISLSLDFSGDDTCKIWKNGNDLMFMDANNSDGVSLSGLVGGSGECLWQDMGTYVQLIEANCSVSLRGQYITNLHDPQYSTDAATKNYVDTVSSAYLPLAGGQMDSEAGIDMQMGYLSEIGSLRGGLGWDFVFYGSDDNTTSPSLVEFMKWKVSTQTLLIGGNGVDITGNDIVNVHHVNGTTDTPLILDFMSDSNYVIWTDGANGNLMFKDANNSSGVSLSGLVGGSGECLWQSSDGVTSLMTPEPINLQDKYMYGIDYFQAYDATGIVVHRYAGAPSSRIILAPNDYAFTAMANADMNTKKIIGLGAGDASSNDAARMVDLDSYMLLSVYDPMSDGVVVPTAGGTGIGSYTKGDILYAGATDVLYKLAAGSEGQVLTMSSGVPAWVSGGSGECLWQDMGTYVQLTTPKDVSLKNYSIKDVFNIYAYDSGSTDDDFSILSNTGVLGFNIKFTDNNPSAIDTYADLNVHGHDIKDAYNILFHPDVIYDYLYLKSASGNFTIATFLTYNDIMGAIHIGNNVDIKDVGKISGNSTISLNLDFSDDDTCKIWKNGNDLMFKDANNSDGVSLSGLVGGGTGLWEEVSETTIQPKDHDIIQGRSGYDLTIKPASGGILYLG